MEQYQRILLCVDEPRRDCWMLDYVSAICRVGSTEELHLLHVRPPLIVLADAPIELMPTDDVTVESLQEIGADFLESTGGPELLCNVVDGPVLIEILRYAMEKEIDLIVMGRPASSTEKGEDSAVLSRRVARKATCSVLVLPEGCKTKADKILVPVRDSECSANAVKRACQIAKAVDGTVCCLNVFPVGSGYSKVGTTLEEHLSLLGQNARHECERMLIGVDAGDVKMVSKCVPDLYSRPVTIILDEIEHEAADLVVIGARGRSGAAGVLLGKVTEKLIRRSPVPVLAVKKKGECLSILQALLVLAG